VRGQAPNEGQGILAGSVAAFLGHRHGQFRDRPARPDNPQTCDAPLVVDGEHGLGDDGADQLLALLDRRGRRPEPPLTSAPAAVIQASSSSLIGDTRRPALGAPVVLGPADGDLIFAGAFDGTGEDEVPHLRSNQQRRTAHAPLTTPTPGNPGHTDTSIASGGMLLVAYKRVSFLRGPSVRENYTAEPGPLIYYVLRAFASWPRPQTASLATWFYRRRPNGRLHGDPGQIALAAPTRDGPGEAPESARSAGKNACPYGPGRERRQAIAGQGALSHEVCRPTR
jgi:hypothetical protein